MANELITVEINSKNKRKLIDLLNESNLVVEILNETDTFNVVRDHATITIPIDERINPQPQVLEPFNYNISTTV